MALTNKLTAIAKAIRKKTAKIDKLTLDQMVEEINKEWLLPGEQKIKDYVKSFYIQDDGEHYNKEGQKVDYDDDWDDFDWEPIGPTLSKGPVIYSYTPEGYVLLTARPTSNSYENVEWNLQRVPDTMNVQIWRKEFGSGKISGHSGKYESCVLVGIDRNVQIFVDCGSRTSGNNSVILNIHIYDDYITE